MRAWRSRKSIKMQENAYFQGVAALRQSLTEVFKTIGRAELSGHTAVQIVSNCAAKVPRGTLS